MKAIIIDRISTEEQREAGNSLPTQIARLEKYCQGKNSNSDTMGCGAGWLWRN